jgi:hypothetical protein
LIGREGMRARFRRPQIVVGRTGPIAAATDNNA